MRAIAAGVEATYPRYRAVWNDDASCVGRGLRLLLGDDPSVQYPSGPIGPRRRDALPQPRRCLAVWVVGPADWVGDLQAEAAVSHSIPVTRMTPDGVERVVAGGVASMRRQQAETTQRVVDAVVAGIVTKPDFGGARAVLSAYFAAESWQLGGGAMDYERALAKVQGGVGFRAGAETMALRIVKAHGLVRAAGWSKEERAAAQARAAGYTWRQVATVLGWPDDGKSDDRARRLQGRALQKVTRALRAQEAAA